MTGFSRATGARLPKLPRVTDSDLGSRPHDHTVPSAPGASPGLPAGLLGAWRAPVVAYGVTLAASIVLAVLTLVALSSGDAPSEVEEVSDVTSGALAMLAVPFQLTAMALGGRIGFGTDDFSVSLMALPLLLTATYVVALGRLAARAEARTPSRSRQERALTSGAAAVVAAVAVALVTRLLAIRADGTAIHALSVSLVIGTLALTFAADFVGRELRSVGVPEAARGWAPAVVTWASHVGLWLAVSFPVLFVLAWANEGFRAALSTPLWWPTGALWTYAMGHLSGVGTSGYYSYAWSDGGLLAPLALVLGAVVATTFASVVWHLRARRSAADLALPASWTRLPATFALGGVIVTIVSAISVGGGVLGLGGSFTIMPAAWTCLLLALWGLAAEAMSRSVAPRLATALPPAVVARLRGPDAPAAVDGVPAPEQAATEPMTPEQARRLRRIVVLVGAGLGVLVAGAVAISVIGSTWFTPEKAAQDYVDALAAGDVETIAATLPDGQDLSSSLLTDEVYEAADERPTDYAVGEVTTLGDSATVEVEATDGVGGESYLSLEKGDRKFGFFQEWEVTEGLTSSLDISSGDAEQIAVNGVTVDAPSEGYGSFAVLPGTYSVDVYAGNEWVEGEASEVPVPLGDYASAETSSPQPSDAFVQRVDDEIGSWLDGCMTSTEADPDGCPQSAYVYGDVRNLTWELTEAPVVDYDYFDPAFPMTLYVSDGQATATYEYDESYGFGPRQWTEETEESSLDFSIEVDVVGDDLEVSPETY